MRLVEHALAGTTILVGGLLLLLLGGPRPVEGARVYVSPGDTVRALRVVTVARDHDLEAPLQGRTIVLERDARVLARTTSDDQGVADVVLDVPLALPASVVLRVGDRAEVVTLARGGATTTTPSLVSLANEGDLRIGATLERGAIVSPFSEALLLTVVDALGAPVDAELATEIEGGSPARARGRTTSGALRLEVRADEPVLHVGVTAIDPVGRRGTARGEIRALLGSCVLAREAALVVRCPGMRSRLFYSTYRGALRTGGGSVLLTPDAEEFASGDLPRGIDADEMIVLAGDAIESGAATIAWPFPGRAAPGAVPRLGPSGETLSAGVLRESTRRLWVRGASSVVLALGLAASLLLALRRVRGNDGARDNAPGADAIPLARDRRRSRLRAVPLVLLLAAAGVAVALLLGTR